MGKGDTSCSESGRDGGESKAGTPTRARFIEAGSLGWASSGGRGGAMAITEEGESESGLSGTRGLMGDEEIVS